MTTIKNCIPTLILVAPAGARLEPRTSGTVPAALAAGKSGLFHEKFHVSAAAKAAATVAIYSYSPRAAHLSGTNPTYRVQEDKTQKLSGTLEACAS